VVSRHAERLIRATRRDSGDGPARRAETARPGRGSRCRCRAWWGPWYRELERRSSRLVYRPILVSPAAAGSRSCGCPAAPPRVSRSLPYPRPVAGCPGLARPPAGRGSRGSRVRSWHKRGQDAFGISSRTSCLITVHPMPARADGQGSGESGHSPHWLRACRRWASGRAGRDLGHRHHLPPR
jgi:hypothetical protein